MKSGLPNDEVAARARLAEVLSYDPHTGKFTWKVSPSANTSAGGEAGHVMARKGYVQISIDGRRYVAHRLAWLYERGAWPKHQIDHLNGLRADNRIENLRDVTASVNQISRSGRKARGVTKLGDRWKCVGCYRGKVVYIGCFDSFEAAIEARMEFEVRKFGEKAGRTERQRYAA